MNRSAYGFPALAALLLTSAMVGGCSETETPKSEPTATTAKKPTPTPAKKAAPAGDAKPTAKKGGAPSLADAKGSYEIDSPHSTVVFRINHAGLSSTYGTFNKITGKMTIDAEASKSSVEIDVDAASLFTADKKRDDHIKGPDFLNVKQFPKMSFKSKSVAAAGAGKFKVDGDLTLHGVTKPVSLTLDHIGAGPFPMDKSYRVGFEGTLEIKRSDFDMKNMLGAVGDELRLIIAIEGVRK